MTADISHPIRLADGTELAPRVLLTRDVESLTLLPHLRTAPRLAAVRPLFFKKMVATVDGSPVTMAQADTWAADPVTTELLLPRFQSVLTEGRRAGIAHAQCPACRSWEASLDLDTMANALETPLPALFDGEALAIPKLSHPLRRGRRPVELAPTSRLRATLPSAHLGMEMPLRETIVTDVEPDDSNVPAGITPAMPGPREAAAWQRWAPDGVPRPAGGEHWRRETPAFQAILRVALAIDVDGLGNPQTVESMPAIDFYFLDALYWLTHAVDVSPNERVAIHCGLCDADFLPVR